MLTRILNPTLENADYQLPKSLYPIIYPIPWGYKKEIFTQKSSTKSKVKTI